MKFYGVYIIWRDPLIVSCFAGAKEQAACYSIREPADILFHPPWLWRLRRIPWFLKMRIRDAFTNKKAHYICSSPEETRLLTLLGLPGTLSSLSCYINEHAFTIDHQVVKQYRAVYAANMMGYKRMSLARKIENLFILTYGSVKDSSGDFDLPAFCPEVSHAIFNRQLLDRDEVVKIYQQAKVGLALSSLEGAMLAFVEYMLCGLPVVTTPSRGGREEFFDQHFVRRVDADATKIANAVGELIDEQISPELIRDATLERLLVHRIRFCRYVVQIIEARGGESPGVESLYAHLYGAPDGIFRHYVHRHALDDAGIPTVAEKNLP